MKKNKTIRALTVLAASLFSLDALTAGYFLVKHFKEKNSTVQTEENKTATETQPPTEETTETVKIATVTVYVICSNLMVTFPHSLNHISVDRNVEVHSKGV